MSVENGVVSLDAVEISELYDGLVNYEDNSKVESSFYTTVVRALKYAESVGLYELNSGNPYWDFLVRSFIRIMRSERSRKVKEYFISGYVYIILSELWCVLEDTSHIIEDNEELKYFKQELPILLDLIRKGKFSSTTYNNRVATGKENKVAEYDDKYQAVLREYRERKLLREEIYSILDVEKSKLDDLKKSMTNELLSLSKAIDKTKSDIDVVKTDSSFLIGWAGIEGLVKDLSRERSVAIRVRYVMMFLVFASIFYLVVTLNAGIVSNTLGLQFGFHSESGLELISSSGNSSVYYAINLAKSVFVNVVILSCSVFFYKVALADERRVTSELRELEFKSAITAFQEANLARVKNMGGDVAESLNRYEEFLYDRWVDSSGEFKDKDVSFGDKKEYLSIMKSVVSK